MISQDTRNLGEQIAECIYEKKGKDVVLIDLKGKSDFADMFLIATIESDPQAQAVADHIIRSVKTNHGIKPHHREGQFKVSKWFIIDYVDVVVHLFKPEERERYKLEKLWQDGELTIIEDKGA